MKRVLSGMRPTGKLHIGHYVGALVNWLKMQREFDCFFFVADWHALTSDYADTSRIKEYTLDLAIDWLACGLDPARATLFVQSHIPEHAELNLLLGMVTPLGWLYRVPTYKEQRDNIKDKDLDTFGFLGYPVLQAADIVMYKANYVPVGEDQVAHVELTREIVRRFNNFYPLPEGRAVFPEPEAYLTPTPRLPGLDGRKMSKSYGNAILLSEPEADIRKKIATMMTDPARVRRTDKGTPELCPVFDYHNVVSTPEVIAWADQGCRTAGIGCLECKRAMADGLMQVLRPIQERRREYEEQPRRAWQVLEEGDERARRVAGATMDDVRQATHLTRSLPTPGT
ncbi:MAG: tryptophan--tRNA ligase [Acidobacteria bacterium]|nr:tryptophan--tRNA ligase [Acidobacteriota bacterium]